MSRPWGRDGDFSQPRPDPPAASEGKHYVVFNCQACGAKIFAEAGQIGRAGVCPACKQMTGVAPRDPTTRVAGPGSKSGTTTGETKAPPITGAIGSASRARASDRRKARRVPVDDAHVGVEAVPAGGRPGTSSGELSELLDISETGVGFMAPGEKDRKKLSGFGPPPIKLGEVVTITLHVPALFRPRTVKATVRRVEQHSTRKDLFRIGAEFVGLAEDARSDIRRMVERRG